MVVEFISTYGIGVCQDKVASLIPTCVEVYSLQLHVIAFISNLRQIGGFLRILQFPPPLKLTTTILQKH